MKFEVWHPNSRGGWTKERHHTYSRRWRAKLAAWWYDAGLPRDSYFRGAIVCRTNLSGTGRSGFDLKPGTLIVPPSHPAYEKAVDAYLAASRPHFTAGGWVREVEG